MPSLIARNTTVEKEWATVHLLSALTKVTTELKQRQYDEAEQAALQPSTDVSKMPATVSAANATGIFSPPGSPGAPPPPNVAGTDVPEDSTGAGAAEEGGDGSTMPPNRAAVERRWRHQQHELPQTNLNRWAAVFTGTPMHTDAAAGDLLNTRRESPVGGSLRSVPLSNR